MASHPESLQAVEISWESAHLSSANTSPTFHTFAQTDGETEAKRLLSF